MRVDARVYMFMKVCIARAGGMRQCGACRSSYAGAAVMLHVRRTFSCTGISTYDARSRLSYAARWDCPCGDGSRSRYQPQLPLTTVLRRMSTSAECGSGSCGSDLLPDTTESSPEVRINLQRSCSVCPVLPRDRDCVEVCSQIQQKYECSAAGRMLWKCRKRCERLSSGNGGWVRNLRFLARCAAQFCL